jgi:hypothetical protein
MEATILNKYLNFLGESEAICKMALAPESGPNVGLIDEKTEVCKSWDTVPLIPMF